MLCPRITPYTLEFAFTAHTSRESLTTKTVYFLHLTDLDGNKTGVGEISPFPSLQPSFRSIESFEQELNFFLEHINEYLEGRPLPKNSAIRFGFETALLDMRNGGVGRLYPQNILKQLSSGIPINGLVWMNDIDTMQRQIAEKIKAGFKCIKLKIGAHDFDKELNLIKQIRETYKDSVLQIRVDANGAFSEKDVFSRLDALAKYDVHSIEQPLKRDSVFMAEVCKNSPLPIALDEDMIERWWSFEQMCEWLCNLSPAYIVLKPSLVGGFKQADKWIDAANEVGVKWWATSALESNIGLSAIAQWLATHPESLSTYQGLGTGQIYVNNPSAPVHLEGDRLYLDNI